MTTPKRATNSYGSPITSTDLSGRTAVVTGASRGIGAATAAALARAGARVLDLSRASGTDLAQPADLSRAIARVKELAPDILVNNAGAFALARFEDAELDAMWALNVSAPFQLIRAVLPGMRERGSGHIVSVGSVADHVAFPENAAYATTKYALRGMHEVLREELRGSPVRATLISPAAVDTPLWNTIGMRPSTGMLSAETVAEAIVFAVTHAGIDEIRLSHP